jgi:hypothetical protein
MNLVKKKFKIKNLNFKKILKISEYFFRHFERTQPNNRIHPERIN